MGARGQGVQEQTLWRLVPLEADGQERGDGPIRSVPQGTQSGRGLQEGVPRAGKVRSKQNVNKNDYETVLYR